ncbi:MAG: galactose oxidase-like domain-containing protein [Chloroflexota bacterium]
MNQLPGSNAQDVEPHHDVGVELSFEHNDQQIAAELQRIRAENPEQLTQEPVFQSAVPDDEPENYGEWSDVINWPIHATHAALMPDKTIVAWHNFAKGVDVYDLETGTHRSTIDYYEDEPIDTWLFCAGFSHLPDGRLLTAGGNSKTANQTDVGLLFDPADIQFRETDSLEYPRYYATATTLASGEIFVFGGNWASDSTPDYPEIYNLSSGWRTLSDVSVPISHNQYHWVQQAPNGKVFYAGPGRDLAYVDLEDKGTWTEVGRRDSLYRSYGSYVMYDVGRFLTGAGAGAVDGISDKSAYTIEIYADSDDVDVNQTDDLLYPRRQSMFVILADGTVFALGGNSSDSFTDWPNGVLPTEIWDPVTGKWSEMAAMGHTRQYHASALLLPDGRVFTGGGGNDAGFQNEEYIDAEFFSPPYLFDENGNLADRPVIASVPAFANHGDTLSIQMSAVTEVQKVHLIRLGAFTHAQDSSARLVPLSFTVTEAQIEAAIPESLNIVVPGYYMLFVLNDEGVPSVAEIVNIGGKASLVLNTPGNQQNFQFDTIDITLNAYNPNSDTLTFSATGLPDGLTINQQTGRISGTLTQTGTFTTELKVDGDNDTSAVSITWLVEEPSGPVNTPPVITLPESQVSRIGDNVSFQLEVTDAENHTLAFLADGLPDGLSINTNTGLISGVPTKADLFFPNVSVTDEEGAVAGTQFGWRIDAAPLSVEPIKTTPLAVGESVQYAVVASGWPSIEYKWDFQDGTPESAYSGSPSISHTFATAGRYTVKVTMKDDADTTETIEFIQIVYPQPTAFKPQVSTGLMTTVGNDGEKIWNVNPDNNSVTVYDLDTKTVEAEIPVGQNPRSLAEGPDGKIWVVNKMSDKLSLIDPATKTVAEEIALPPASQPYGIVFNPQKTAAFVTLDASGQLLMLDPASGTVLNTVSLGLHLRHLSIDAFGQTVYVSRFITPPLSGEGTKSINTSSGGGEILAVDVQTFTLDKTILLQYSNEVDTDHSGSGLPNYLGPLIISPDGSFGFVPSKQDNITRGMFRNEQELDHDNTMRSISSYVNLAQNEEVYQFRIDHDDAAMPVNGVFDQNGIYYFALMEGSQEIRVVNTYGNEETTLILTGLAPQHITLSSDGTLLLVHNFLDRSVIGFDITDITVNDGNDVTEAVRYTAVENEKLSATILLGKQLFYEGRDSRLSLAPYLTCAACHVDGGHDGRTWDMTGMGEGLRNTPSLNGRAGMGHGPIHWSGNFDEIHDFENQIRAMNEGSGLLTDEQFAAHEDPLGLPKAGLNRDLDALAAYVSSLGEFRPSPYSNPDGELSSDALAGQSLFEVLSCSSCHSGPEFTDSPDGLLHDIGTMNSGSGSRLGASLPGIDTPTLLDVWQTAPYLHNGSAETLAAAIQAHDGISLNGVQLDQLSAYLLQLGGAFQPDTEPEPTPTTPAQPEPTETPVPETTPTPSTEPTPTAEPEGCGEGLGQCIYLPFVTQD